VIVAVAVAPSGCGAVDGDTRVEEFEHAYDGGVGGGGVADADGDA